MKENLTGTECENRINIALEEKWVKDKKEGLDKEKKGTQKVKGKRVKEAKIRGPHSFLGAHT